jgi:hypothetical protein
MVQELFTYIVINSFYLKLKLQILFVSFYLFIYLCSALETNKDIVNLYSYDDSTIKNYRELFYKNRQSLCSIIYDSEIGFCLRLHVEPTQVGLTDRASLSLSLSLSLLTPATQYFK